MQGGEEIMYYPSLSLLPKYKTKSAYHPCISRHISMAINKTASRNILHKIIKMINVSNEQQRRTSASMQCEDLFFGHSLRWRAWKWYRSFNSWLGYRIYANVISQANKIEAKIVIKKKLIARWGRPTCISIAKSQLSGVLHALTLWQCVPWNTVTVTVDMKYQANVPEFGNGSLFIFTDC